MTLDCANHCNGFDAVRSAGATRSVAHYEGRDGEGAVSRLELYVAVPNDAGGNHYLDPDLDFAASERPPVGTLDQEHEIWKASEALLHTRHRGWHGLHAGGKLLADSESNRVWLQENFEVELTPDRDASSPLLVER